MIKLKRKHMSLLFQKNYGYRILVDEKLWATRHVKREKEHLNLYGLKIL